MNQSIFSFDLKDVAGAFELQCAKHGATGRARGEYLRQLIRNAQEEPIKPPGPSEIQRAANGRRRELRTTVAPEVYDKFIAAVNASNTKSIARYLEVVATNAVPVEYHPPAPKSLQLAPEVMTEITNIGRELMAIGRNVNQIAKSLHLHPGKTTEKDRVALQLLPAAIHRGMDVLSSHLLALSPPRYGHVRSKARSKKQ